MEVTKSIGIVIVSFCCDFTYILSHSYLCFYSVLAKEKKKIDTLL